MPRDPRINTYLEANKSWSQSPSFASPMAFLEMQRRGRGRVDGTVILLTCCDPRLNIEASFGIDVGGGMSSATIIRVAGGRVHAALNTMMVLSAVGNEGKKGLIIIVHHTDCGLSHITDAEIKRSLKERAVGTEEQDGVEKMVFGAIDNPEETVKEDVRILRASSWFKGTQIVGLVQVTETGLLREILWEDVV